MKKILTILFLCFTFQISAFADDEISLFDSGGQPIAYVAEELTIYLWSGKPIAYLYSQSGKLRVYGFNGKHLGWYVKGLIYDHDGNAVGGVREAFSSYLAYEPYKAHKQYKPYKAYREYAPYQPYLSNNWSDMPLKIFLLQGSSN